MKELLILALFLAGVSLSLSSREKPGPGGSGELEVATFAGGCFWCMESAFHPLEGVEDVVAGYTGGHTENPTYEEVSTGETGHYEAVRVRYDPQRVTYGELLNVFWGHVDPTDPAGQFADRGPQYRTAVFVHDEVQRRIAELSRDRVNHSRALDEGVVTEILPAQEFYEAEEGHQDYFEKRPVQFNLYKRASGRLGYVREWESPFAGFEKPGEEGLREQLTPLQFRVTQQGGTEPAFDNEYEGNDEPGIYVDVVSGEPLFSSQDKFHSGSGWPSFTRVLEPLNLFEVPQGGRVEVRSMHAGSHLGHVFRDGPPPTGMRYCINSAALRFVPAGQLEAEGYGRYAGLFE